MGVFSLTETELFRKLTDGENDNLPIAYKEFVLQVCELCNKEPHKGCVISALLFVEVEISHLQTAAQRKVVNDALVSFINKALYFVRQTLLHYKEIDFRTVGEESMLDRFGLDWKANKTDLVEFGYAFKGATCFDTELIAKDTFSIFVNIFKVDRAENIYKKISEMRIGCEGATAIPT